MEADPKLLTGIADTVSWLLGGFEMDRIELERFCVPATTWL
jgi:hypothetical protein